MSEEISVILDFVLTPLYKNLPRRRVDCFAEELDKSLRQRFEQFWSEHDIGSCCTIQFNGPSVDSAVKYAADISGLGCDEVKRYLPQGLTIWVNKGNVTYSEDGGEVQVLLSKTPTPSDPFYPSPIPTESWSIWGKTDGCGSGWKQPWLAPPVPIVTTSNAKWHTSDQSGYNMYQSSKSHAQVFTSAEFAATKFGSMKLRGQMRKPQRVSPTFEQQYSNAFISPMGSPNRSVPDILPIASQSQQVRQSISPFFNLSSHTAYPDVSPPGKVPTQFPQPQTQLDSTWLRQWGNENQQLNSTDVDKGLDPFNLLPVSLQQILLAN